MALYSHLRWCARKQSYNQSPASDQACENSDRNRGVNFNIEIVAKWWSMVFLSLHGCLCLNCWYFMLYIIYSFEFALAFFHLGLVLCGVVIVRHRVVSWLFHRGEVLLEPSSISGCRWWLIIAWYANRQPLPVVGVGGQSACVVPAIGHFWTSVMMAGQHTLPLASCSYILSDSWPIWYLCACLTEINLIFYLWAESEL